METQLVEDRNAFIISYLKKTLDKSHSPEEDEIKESIQPMGNKTFSGGPLSNDKILNRGEVLTLVHEIKNPLTNIVLSMSYLNDGNTDPERALYFEIINRSARRINDLVNGLLASTAYEFEKEICPLNDLVLETLDLAFDRVTLKKITTLKNLTTENCRVEVDKPRMKIAVLNIIVNAIEAMKTDVGQLTLTTNSYSDFCEIMIRDNGVGIKKENITRLFDPYFSNKNAGTGLGLTVSKQIFDYHNFTLEVWSEEGEGTVFTVRLPTVH